MEPIENVTHRIRVRGQAIRQIAEDECRYQYTHNASVYRACHQIDGGVQGNQKDGQIQCAEKQLEK